MCLGVVAILLLNVVDGFSVCGGALLDKPCMVFQRVCCVCVPSYGALEKRSFQSISLMPFMILYTSIRSPKILLVSRVVRFRLLLLLSTYPSCV